MGPPTATEALTRLCAEYPEARGTVSLRCPPTAHHATLLWGGRGKEGVTETAVLRRGRESQGCQGEWNTRGPQAGPWRESCAVLGCSHCDHSS